jgi:hypothetical protein
MLISPVVILGIGIDKTAMVAVEDSGYIVGTPWPSFCCGDV